MGVAARTSWVIPVLSRSGVLLLAVVLTVGIVWYWEERLSGAGRWVEVGGRAAPVARWTVMLSVADLRVARGPDEVVGYYVALNVRAKVGPGLVGMVNLVLALCED